MLTKKDFKVVAEIIKNNLPGKDNDYCDGVRAGLYYTANDLADYFATQNPRFDRERFMVACGL